MSEKQPEYDWESLGYAKFISWKQMVGIIVTIAIFTQIVAQFITPTSWTNYQLLAFITATNVGAVILAVMAQRSAEDIREMYTKAFTPSFYATVSALSNVRDIMIKEAEAEGNSLEEDMEGLTPKLYGFLRKYVETQDPANAPPLPDIPVHEAPEYEDEDELFI